MSRLLSTLLASTALWAAPDAPGNEPVKVAPLDLGEFDAAMGDVGASGQETDGFEEISQEQAQEEILSQHQTRQHIDADDDESSTSVRQDGDGGTVEDGGQRAKPKAPDAATPPAPAAAAEAEDEAKLPPWVQERLAREKRKTARAVAEAAEARKTVAPAPAATPPAPAAPSEAPKAADFEDFEEYMEAKALYERSQKDAKNKPAPKADPANLNQPTQLSEQTRIQVAGVIGEINSVLKDDHPELFKVFTDPANPKNLKITPSMILAIGETDNPVAVLQAFADNPELTVELAGLPPEKAAARIVKLDKPGTPAKAAPAAAPAKAPTPKLSQAPEPVAPLNGENRSAPSHEESDFNTFEAARRAEEKADDPFGW